MTNVLKPEKQEEIRALGRLGWTLRRIEEATGVRRETVGRYLRWAGIRVPPPRGRSLRSSKAASEVTTDLERPPRPGTRRPASPCEPNREAIATAFGSGRPWQQHLRRYLAGRTTGPVFARRDGPPITARHAHRRLALLAGKEAAPAGSRPHGLRRHHPAYRVIPRRGRVAALLSASPSKRPLADAG